MWSQPIRIQLRKILWENLAGNSCGTGRREKSQFKKGCDWWKFSIWNRVIGSQPIRIQLGKILWESLAGKSCGKFFQENLVGNACGKILQEIPVQKSCRKILRENLAGNSCGTGRRKKSQFKKGSDWLKFSIWNRVIGSQPIRIQLGKILRGKSCRKILQENLAGNLVGNLAINFVGNAVGNSPYLSPNHF